MLRLLADHLPAPVQIELARCYEPPAQQYLISDLTLLPTLPDSGPSLPSLLLEYLDKRKEQLSGLNVTTNALAADAAAGILERCEHNDLVLMASHGRSGLGRWLMGSVAHKVSRGATIPVLVIGSKLLSQETSTPVRIAKILVALDGSPCAERALQRAADWAHHLGASLILYRGVTQTTVIHELVARANQEKMDDAKAYLERLAATVSGLVKVEVAIREAQSSAGVVECAAEHEADLIVVGSHGRSGLVRWTVGSQTDHVLHHAPCPVLVTH